MQNNNNILRFLTFYQIERGLRVTHVIMYAGNIIIVWVTLLKPRDWSIRQPLNFKLKILEDEIILVVEVAHQEGGLQSPKERTKQGGCRA